MVRTTARTYRGGYNISQKPRTSKLRNLLILGLCLVGTAVITQEGAVTGHATGGGAGGCGGEVQWDGDIL